MVKYYYDKDGSRHSHPIINYFFSLIVAGALTYSGCLAITEHFSQANSSRLIKESNIEREVDAMTGSTPTQPTTQPSNKDTSKGVASFR